MNLREPDIERLLRAFAIKTPDRVPVVEIMVNSPTLEHVMGKALTASLTGSYAVADLADFPMADSGAGRSQPQLYAQQDPALSTMNITPEEYVEFCRRTSFDAMVVPIQWTGLPDFTSSRGALADWPDLERMSPPPDMDFIGAHLQRYIDATRGTGIGVAVFGASCFQRTYEALGFENFCLKLYDDPAFVTHVMDIFTDYSVAVAETASQLDIAFYWYADDIADNRGLMVHPKVLDELWLPRVQRILAPYRAARLPIAYHCDGNLARVIPLALTLGFSAIQPVQANCNDIYEIKRDFGDRLCLMGNVDAGGVLAFGSREDVIADTIAHLEGLAPGGGYALGSSHSITPAVRPENFVAMVETAVTSGVYDRSALR